MPKPTAILEVEEDLTDFTAPLIYDDRAPQLQEQLSIYPDELLDSADPVRPGESKQEHKKRVQELVEQIREDGQRQPITVRNDPSFGPLKLRVVDGQGRLEALRILDIPAWCVLLEDSVDPWAAAVKLNVQRKNYNDLQLALLMKEARTRLNLNGKQVAAMFGIKEPLLVEYGKIADAPKAIQEAVQSGELNRSVALKLIESTPGATPEKQRRVVEKAKEIAAQKPKVLIGTPEDMNGFEEAINDGPALKIPKGSKVIHTVEPIASQESHPAVKVQARHIAEAARVVAAESNEPVPSLKRSKSEILTALRNLSDLMPLEEGKLDDARLFLAAIQQFADGEITPKQLQNKWHKVMAISERRREKRS
jgi:ParB/RepB/Spo0J family partition protein